MWIKYILPTSSDYLYTNTILLSVLSQRWAVTQVIMAFPFYKVSPRKLMKEVESARSCFCHDFKFVLGLSVQSTFSLCRLLQMQFPSPDEAALWPSNQTMWKCWCCWMPTRSPMCCQLNIWLVKATVSLPFSKLCSCTCTDGSEGIKDHFYDPIATDGQNGIGQNLCKNIPLEAV